MKRVFLLILIIFFIFISPQTIFAQSKYVLPYPSFMPGNKLYIVQSFTDRIKQYWYFGSFAQFTYNLQQADKYLVETKTLFEYDQYYLGYKALEKSDHYFKKLPNNLENAKKQKKDITQKQELLMNASEKHIAVLNQLLHTVPSSFQWQEEKKDSIDLALHQKIQAAIALRMETL